MKAKRVKAWCVIDSEGDFCIPNEQLSIYDSKEAAEFYYEEYTENGEYKIVPYDLVKTRRKK